MWAAGISGAKDRRPELDRLMHDAQKQRLDAVVVDRFDRFARSTKHLVTALEEFHSLGIDFISLTESVASSPRSTCDLELCGFSPFHID
jgi:DNA invertase Pin-like site-specific DNA recombinase